MGGFHYTARAPNTWTFSGSNDNSEWTVLDTQTGETDWIAGEFRSYTVANSMPYKYYKFNCTALNGATDCLQILELEFYNSTGVPVEATWSGRGATASLSDVGNWYPALPGAVSTVTIGGTGESPAIIPAGTTSYHAMYVGDWTNATVRQTQGTLSVDTFTLGRNPRGNAIYAISGGTLEASSLSYLGAYGGTGSLDIDGDGVVIIQDKLQFGFGSSESPTHGRVSIAGNGSLSATSMELGCLDNSSTSGEIIQTGGECRTDNDIFVGYGNGSSGNYEMTGGTCSTRLLSVGRYGTGTFSISGPATVMTATNGVCVGFTSGGNNGVGTVVVTNGGTIATTSVYGGGTAANQAFVTFDEGVLQATVDNATILDKLANIDLKAGGLALETAGYNLGIANCTFNVTPGAKIAVTGGGEVSFEDVTVNLTEAPSRSFTFAETDGTFSGMPNFSYGRWKMVKSADSKRISILSPGLILFVR